MKKRAVIASVLSALIYQVYHHIGSDWKDDKPILDYTNPLEGLAKRALRFGNGVPGIRLMYGGEDGFPLEDITYWDSVCGVAIYCVAFIFMLWMLTPLPDINVNLFLVTSFRSRAIGPEEDFDPDEMHIPRWHPAGGEGPVLHLDLPDVPVRQNDVGIE